MNQDALENFFGCVRSCQSSSLIATHFRSGYATVFVNNLTSAHSIKSNCAPDLAKPLLTEMDDFFLNDRNGKVCESERNDGEVNGCDREKCLDGNSNLVFNSNGENDCYEYDFDPISVEIRFSVEDVDSKYTFTDASNLVCDKLLKSTKCDNCRATIEIQNENDQHSIKLSSDLFTESFIRVCNAIKIILPQICEQKLLKIKVLKYLDDHVNIDEIGCSEHHEALTQKFKEYSTTWGILSFCKNVNDLLSGKNLTLSKNCNIIEENAFKFNEKKKKVGKHSDLFK